MDHLCGSGEVNGYDWFMLAMDDTYIRPDNLLHLLNMADNRKKVLAQYNRGWTRKKLQEIRFSDNAFP